jgi:murein DD-endopeptidase MepM/ murein hydrolase activator NlpD
MRRFGDRGRSGWLVALGVVLAAALGLAQVVERAGAGGDSGAGMREHLLAFTATLAGPAPSDAGGAGVSFAQTAPEISPAQRAAVRAEVQRNLERLRGEGLTPFALGPVTVRFGWPLRFAPGVGDHGYHATSNFVDHDTTGGTLDYMGQHRTYNGHTGTDVFLWPFPWLTMDRGDVQVVAAAAGTIVARQDGQFDRHCTTSPAPANYVVLAHADGTRSLYWHLKKGSVTSKGVGASVKKGQYLGLVGSSGTSTGPHLHFEVEGPGDTGPEPALDPFDGPFNPTTDVSLWLSQRPYRDPAVNHIATGIAAPVIPACPDPETPGEDSVFSPGERVYFLTYYRDQLTTTSTRYRIRRPDGSLFSEWTSAPASDYSASYWYWSHVLPAGAPLGAWRFEARFAGTTYAHDFELCDARPGAPAALGPADGAELDDRTVALSWTARACASWYEVTVRRGSKTGPVVVRERALAGVEHTTKTLARGHTYVWRASACSRLGCGHAAWRDFRVTP